MFVIWVLIWKRQKDNFLIHNMKSKESKLNLQSTNKKQDNTFEKLLRNSMELKFCFKKVIKSWRDKLKIIMVMRRSWKWKSIRSKKPLKFWNKNYPNKVKIILRNYKNWQKTQMKSCKVFKQLRRNPLKKFNNPSMSNCKFCNWEWTKLPGKKQKPKTNSEDTSKCIVIWKSISRIHMTEHFSKRSLKILSIKFCRRLTNQLFIFFDRFSLFIFYSHSILYL